MPSPFLVRTLIQWLATQTMMRTEQMVVEEMKSRVQNGDLGSFEGVLFKDAFKSSGTRRITAGGVDLGVVVAMKREIVGLLDKMGTPKVTKGASFKYYVGSWKGRSIAIIETGEGLTPAREGTAALIQTFSPSRVASVGFATPLVSSIPNRSLFVPDRLCRKNGSFLDLNPPALVVEPPEENVLQAPNTSEFARQEELMSNAVIETCVESTAELKTSCAQDVKSSESSGDQIVGDKTSRLMCVRVEELLKTFRTGTLLSLNAEVPKSSEMHGATAYDHSTWGVADVCREFGTPFLPLRIMYKLPSESVRHEASRAARKNQSFARSFGAFVGATMKNPASALDFYKIKEQELQTADELAEAICRILAVLPVSTARTE